MGPVATAQVAWEFDMLLALVGYPNRLLEIGVWHGGTIVQWAAVAGKVVGVDLDTFDLKLSLPLGPRVALIEGDSTDQAVVEEVRGYGPFDVVFIDADHSYLGAHADWENYAPMVEPGGLVAFHDILPRDGYGVSDLWAEVKRGRRTVEIVGTEPSPHMDDPRAGIGVVWLP